MKTSSESPLVRVDERVEIAHQDEQAELVDLGAITARTQGVPIPGKADTGIGFQPI